LHSQNGLGDLSIGDSLQVGLDGFLTLIANFSEPNGVAVGFLAEAYEVMPNLHLSICKWARANPNDRKLCLFGNGLRKLCRDEFKNESSSASRFQFFSLLKQFFSGSRLGPN
jgi:hypothetical protein